MSGHLDRFLARSTASNVGPTQVLHITTVTNGFGSGVDSMTVRIPRSLAGGPELFVRLAVTVALTP